MIRSIPGTIEVPGREFIYIEAAENETFSTLLDEAMEARPNVPMPDSGGVIEERVRVSLSDSVSLLGMSYKGDVEGWRNMLTTYCASRGKMWGIAKKGILFVSDGSEVPLSHANVTFH